MDNISKMYLINFLVGLQFYGPLSVAFFLDWGHLDYAGMFTIEAVFMLAIFLFQIPTGVFADKYGRKASMLIGLSLAVLSTVIIVSYPDYRVFILAEIVGGAAAAFMSGANNALLFDTLKGMNSEKRAKQVFANYSLFASAAFIISFPIGSFIAGQGFVPYPGILVIPFLLSAATTALACVVALFLSEPHKSPVAETAFELGKKGLAELKNNRNLRGLALDMTMISMTGFFMFWFYQSLLRASGLGIGLWGVVAAGYNLAAVILLSRLESIERIFGTTRLLFLSALMIGLFYLFLSFYSALWLSILAIFVITNMRFIRAPLFNHYINLHVPSERRATVLSAIDMIERLGIAVVYPLVGVLSDISLSLVFLVLGIGALAFAFLLRSNAAAFETGRSHLKS